MKTITDTIAVEIALPDSAETGTLQVMHLKRYWAKALAKRNGSLQQNAHTDEWMTDVAMLSALGLGIEQTIVQIYRDAPSFEEFEHWVLSVNNGTVSQKLINDFNAQLTGKHTANERVPDALTEEQLAFWNRNGYVILRNAVPKEDCDKTVALICDHLGIKRNDPATWYNQHGDKQGIMIQLFQHEQLERNRRSDSIRRAYQQLWQRTDIYVNTDRVGFNPPETDTYKFPGPKLHWDVSLDPPMPFGLQGILYLADTAANQGAFTLVPGFQHRLEEWLNSLPPGADPRTEDIYALGPVPVAANAGDFIIWHHALPHGSSPNTASLPRFVQYINYQPLNAGVQDKWI